MGMEAEEAVREVRKMVLGKYEMGRVLGKGTFSKVYHGRELSSGESVAIKVIDKEKIRREAGLMEQIQREIAVMRLVRHPNVVELREVMATRSRIFFVMEFVRGGELFARVAQGRLSEDQARRYFHQLISAVDFCHSRGVSHRDLKPENLLLDEHGDLKVSDFGLSALPEQLCHDGLLHTQCGTPAYVAPEILRCRGYDGAKADLWSCGVILFVLLAGFLPFQDESLTRMYRKVFKAEYEVPPWFSGEARRLVSRLLVVDPGKRVSIPAIMQLPWFKKGCCRPRPIHIPPPPLHSEDEDTKPATPRFYNAFELISSMATGFDLSTLFESRRKAGTVFTSRSPAAAIVEGLERVGRALGFEVERTESYKVTMEGKTEGRKGQLAVTAEVFEAAAGVAVVEFSKSSGDTLEYTKFCEEGVRPGLKNIVWAWQGDDPTPPPAAGDRLKGTVR
ncbi:cbl-interacting protein kinase [Musa troglodytarum]|uniref:non-specific serine/threonine protein kinase n=2 Tax=Musa troglodytarum TaxID=320322 RepID=A0A9E7L176_9LILI|nr:cbl-interacting protein kinase [Musa troglodytarum]